MGENDRSNMFNYTSQIDGMNDIKIYFKIIRDVNVTSKDTDISPFGTAL